VGCQLGTVRSRLHYAKRALRTILKREKVDD
jgi:DNA-directed RNA polymerase specialized sigma24 family protein